MKTFNSYQKVIAIKEKSAGNESVGNMWIETKSFDPATPVSEIIKWGNNADGKLILTIDETDAYNEF